MADHEMNRVLELAEHFRNLVGRIPGENEPSQPWQDEVVEAVAECFDSQTEKLTPLVQPLVPVARAAAFKGALRKLRERVGRYSPSSNGEIEAALREVGTTFDLMGAPAASKRESDKFVFDAQAIRLKAREVFEDYFRACDRGLNVIPRDPEGSAALQELARKGLARETRSGGVFLIGPRGIDVCMGEADLDQILGLAPPPTPSPSVPAAATTVNVFHGPVAAVAAASGASAHGTVNVQPIDEALRKVIDLQDVLGDLTDALIPLLRTARKHERTGSSEEELAAAVQESEEFKKFESMIKPGLAQAGITAATTVLQLVPLLKPALTLLGK